MTWEQAAPIISQYESAGNPNIGWSGVDLTGVPLSATGFPNWPGKAGPKGNSTAAGLYQIERSTWDPVATKLGIKNFSVESQNAVARELFNEQGFAPWAPYNFRLAQAINWPSNSQAAAELGQAPVKVTLPDLTISAPASGPTPSAPGPSPMPLLALGMAMPKHTFVPVDYDPFALAKDEQTSGDFGPGLKPSTSQIPTTAEPTVASVNAPTSNLAPGAIAPYMSYLGRMSLIQIDHDPFASEPN